MHKQLFSDLRISAGLVLFVAGVCGLTSGSHVYVRDGAAMFFMSQSIIEHRWFDVDIHPNTVGGRKGPDGRYYMPFGILQPLLATPFVAIGRQLMQAYETRYLPFFTITWFNWIVSGGLSALVFLCFRELKTNTLQSFIIGLAVVFATPFWVYAQTFFTEPLTSFLTLLSWLLMYKTLAKNSKIHLFLSGLVSGMIVLIRPLGGLIIPCLMLYFALRTRRSQTLPPRQALTSLLIFLLPAALCVAGYLAYNYIRFGSILDTGYHLLPSGLPRNFTLDMSSGLKILLFSPGKSLFVFSPVLLLALPGLFIWIKKGMFVAEAVFCFTVSLLYIAVISRWARVEGGVTWGPRLILPIVPILMLGLIPLLRKTNRFFSICIYVLVFTGVTVQIPGVLVNFSTYISRHATDYYDSNDGHYRFSFNPIPGHIRELLTFIRDAGHLKQRPENEAQQNRQLEQINPDGIPDIWWLHMWMDRVPGAFIHRTILFLALSIIVGAILLLTGLKSAPDRDS